MAGAYSIARLVGVDAYGQVELLLTEYLEEIAREMTAAGVDLGDQSAMVADRHGYLRTELPRFVDGRGRLLAARDPGGWLGIGILKPIDEHTAEIKRMYVRPEHRGRGIGRALLLELLAAARSEHFQIVRLETMDVLTPSIDLYRSCGFQDTAAFTGSEVVHVGASSNVRYLQLDLSD